MFAKESKPDRRNQSRLAAGLAGLTLLIVGCSSAAPTSQTSPNSTGIAAPTGTGAPATGASGGSVADPVAGASAPPNSSPPVSAATTPNVYSGTGAGTLSAAVAGAKSYVYAPSNDTGSVTVIDQQTMKVVDQYDAGQLAQHVVPSWDLLTLYATASNSNRLVPIDPATGKPGKPISVDAPYNLYFSPDGTTAIVMAERLNRMDFYDRLTWKRVRSVGTGACRGVNHADWSADLSFFVATCEFSGDIIKVDSATGKILNMLPLAAGAMPQDLRLAPDGSKFYVADMQNAGLWVLDAAGTAVTGFIATGVGAHGIYPSRDSTKLYVTNRGRLKHDTARKSREGDGSISVVDPVTDTVVTTWPIPGGGSPDMGGVSADGSKFWVSGRYDSVVYAFDTTSGAMLAKIAVASGPHGLAVFPQPGQYSLGHTGNFR